MLDAYRTLFQTTSQLPGYSKQFSLFPHYAWARFINGVGSASRPSHLKPEVEYARSADLEVGGACCHHRDQSPAVYSLCQPSHYTAASTVLTENFPLLPRNTARLPFPAALAVRDDCILVIGW